MSSLVAVTDATFQAEVIDSSQPVLVDFWAPWCSPCRQLSRVVEQLAAENGDKMKFVMVNTDENPVVSQSYNIVSLPTLNVYKDGELVKSIGRPLPKPLLAAELDEFIG
ncbi:MAG: thioredoxin fold domain-containing protein [Bifidobacteriaceae bacterium]|jgi:thioredoxin 1|nr:thioredoxin fold domain-containing protein [Bifidobacteriaceae bacterium]